MAALAELMLLPLPDNHCALCGRQGPRLDERSKASRRGCVRSCVKGGLSPRDYAIEGALLLELQQLPAGTSVLLERALAKSIDPGDQAALSRARNAARRLCARGQLQILQAGRLVGGEDDAASPIEVRLPQG